MEIPVYLFTGFLESGKTSFIQSTLADKRFNSGEKILVLLCEEGIEELDPSEFASPNVNQIVIEDKSEINTAALKKLENKYKPKRIMIECNGMWMIDELFAAFPQNWVVYQEMMFADASTFISYNTNMRTLMVDKLKGCELLVLNRASDDVDKETVHKIVRGISRRAGIAYEYPDEHVEYDEIEDPLPFDIDAPVVKIADSDYAIWYRDLTEDQKKYDGKTVEFVGIAAKDPAMDDYTFVIGRHVMTCCAEDITYTPLVAVCDKPVQVSSRDWLRVRGRIVLEYNDMYESIGPVIKVSECEKAQPPEEQVATFY